MKIFPTSIRAKLTLIAVTVMGVLFILLGTVVEVAGRQQIMSSVDSELARRAAQIIRAHQEVDRENHPPPGEFVGGPQGPGMGQGPEHGPEDHGDGPDRGPGGQNQPDGGRPNSGPQEPAGPGGQTGADRQRAGGPPGGPRGFGGFLRRLQQIGDPTLAVGPRFVSLSDGPPFAPPDMRQPYDKAAVDLADKKGTAYTTVVVGTGAAAQKMRLISRLAKDDSGRRWVVQVPYPLGQIDNALQTLSKTLLLLLPFGLILTAVACLVLMKTIMRPIREITATADSIGGEDLSGRLTVTGKDEFAQLGTTINGMLGRLENAFDVQRQTLARLESVLKQQRRFTADASHELKTPLAVIKANTGLMLHGSKLNEDDKSSVEAIDSAATRMNRLVQGLMLLARAEAGSPVLGLAPFDLSLAVQNAVDQVHRPQEKQISYSDDGSSFMVSGSERDVERVFVNLIDNACRHTATDGRIDVSVVRAGGEAVVTVTDNGEGIAQEHIPHLFERFYRADSARSTETGGTGLGLAICKGIVEATGGSISITSELGQYTAVVVRLPLVGA